MRLGRREGAGGHGGHSSDRRVDVPMSGRAATGGEWPRDRCSREPLLSPRESPARPRSDRAGCRVQRALALAELCACAASESCRRSCARPAVSVERVVGGGDLREQASASGAEPPGQLFERRRSASSAAAADERCDQLAQRAGRHAARAARRCETRPASAGMLDERCARAAGSCAPSGPLWRAGIGTASRASSPRSAARTAAST